MGLIDNSYVLEEIGWLNFAVMFCNDVNLFYNAIGYIPPHGDKSFCEMKLIKSTANGKHLMNLLLSMQSSLEETFFPRKSFTRTNGIPSSDTINCVRITAEAWKGLAERLNFLSPGLHLSVYPHAVSNEYLTENAFGFTVRKGQGHHQNMMEYVQAKSKHALDFQMHLCDVPFHQQIKVKLRDQGYQDNSAMRSKLDLNDLLEIYSRCAVKNTSVQREQTLSPEDEKVLKAAFFLTKSVPRQTNCCKWREASAAVTWQNKVSAIFEKTLIFV